MPTLEFSRYAKRTINYRIGSGADLEIDSVNIVSGNAYKFTNLKIQLPTSWTW